MNNNFQNMNMMAPRSGNGVSVQQQIIAHYRGQQQKANPGWQQAIAPEERANLAMQFLTQIRMLKPEVDEGNALRQAVQFETTMFNQSQTKDQYVSQVKARLQNMTQMRQQRAQTMQNNLSNGMNPAQMGMMGQPGLQAPRQNTPQQFPQGFPNPQLQRPMQASPIPMAQGGSSMGLNAASLQQGQNGQQPGGLQGQQPRQIDNNMINRIARKIMDAGNDEMRQKFQADVASWPEQKRQQIMGQGMDPLFFRFRQHAQMLVQNGRINVATLFPQGVPQGVPGANQNGQNGGGMQSQAQLNQMQNQQMNQRQPIDFNAIANQQIEALRVQEQGQQVVPATPNGPQMGFPGQPQQQGQAQNAALAQQRQAFQNAHLQRQAQAQAQAQQAQQAQARAQQQMQQAQAQAQANAQQAQSRNGNQMLQGQIGGLNQPNGAGQSPAMSMLNRPMIPPGQTGPTTPQQQPQNHVPRMTPQDPQATTQLMREVQQRVVAQGGPPQPLNEQLRMSLIPPELPAETKQKLLRVPEVQFRAYIAHYMQSNSRRPQQMPNGQFPGQPTLGQPNMAMNPAQAMTMANSMINGATLGNAARAQGMNPGQQTPNGMNGQQPPMGQRPGVVSNPRLQAAAAMLQQNPGIVKSMDNQLFPPNAVNSQVRPHLPTEVKTWGQLKQWGTQNPSLMPAIAMQNLLLLQVLHFQDLRQQQQQRVANQQNNMPGGQMPQQNNPGAIAPPAQMTPGPIQPQPGMANMGNMAMAGMQVTPQELAQIRARLPPQQAANVSDQQLRQWVLQQKMNQRQQQQQQAMAALQAQRAQAVQPQSTLPGPGAVVSRPPPSQPQPAQTTPQPKAANKPPQPSKPVQPTAQTNLNKGIKRPNDDAADSSSELTATNVAPQAPAMVPSKSQQGGTNFTTEQLSKLPLAQQQKMRAHLLKAQEPSNNKQPQRSLPPSQELQARMKDPAREHRFRALLIEEEKNTPKGPPVQTSPEVRAQLQQLIKEKLTHIRKVEQALRVCLAGYEGQDGIEEMARSVFRARTLLLRQITNEGTLQETLTITAADFQQNVRNVLSFVGKISLSMQNMPGTRNAAPQGQQPQPPQSQAQAARQPQLNAANLKIVEAEHSRSQKAPQAPTTDRPPFSFGGGQSPRGAPTYFETAPKVPLTLSLPEKKKQKLDGQAPTPGTKPSPRIGTNKSSPDVKRQSQPERPVEQRQTFKCKAADCEYYHRGFDTQAELEAHIGNAHARVDDPVQFALDAMGEYLDIDPRTGQLKSDPNAANRVTKTPAVAARALQPVKPGQTPSLPHGVITPAGAQAAATPMARVPTQTGIKGSPSTNLLKTPNTGTKVATPSTGGPAKATPSGVRPAMKEAETVTVAQPEQVEDAQPLIPASLFDFSYEDIYSALDTNGPFTTLDLEDEDNSWVLRSRPSSPINTPDSSSKDTPSTRQSDISENDNLQINLDVKDAEMPDAWLAAMSGNPLPLDVQLSEDLQTLGVTLPPMDDSDMMLFYGDSAMMDFDLLDKNIESMGTMDAVVF